MPFQIGIDYLFFLFFVYFIMKMILRGFIFKMDINCKAICIQVIFLLYIALEFILFSKFYKK